MTPTEETVIAYEPLTSETRVKDFVIPESLVLGGKEITLPKSITRKDPHFLLDTSGRPLRAAWISKPLAHILNSYRFDEPSIKIKELLKAVNAVESSISSLVKYGVLRDKHGPGAMAFCQANENVPKDAILISQRTFDTLCQKNYKWKHAKTVMAVRFPNLGPGTTQELKVIVNKPETIDLFNLAPTAIGSRCTNLTDLYSALEMDTHQDLLDSSGIVDAFYLHPETLKDGFQGDGDGDQIFIVLERKGDPIFREITLTREPEEIKQTDVDILFTKASRTSRENITSWLPTYFDDVPIGPATYTIRWILYNHLRKFKDSEHPMADAWQEIAPIAIDMVEFVMDIRKGDWTDKEIEVKMRNIQNKMSEIQKARYNGDWFAKTVTSRDIDDISGFILKFSSLQEYVNLITNQKPLLLKSLEE